MEPTLDADGVVAARAFLMRELAHATLRGEFERVYHERRVRASYAPTHDQTGARKLANMCLRYLGCVDDAAARALAIAQYDAADNMTDTIAALVGDQGQRHAGARRPVRALREPAGATSRWSSTSGSRSRRCRSAPDTLDRVQSAARASALQRAQSESRPLAGRRVRAAQLRALPRRATAAATPSRRTRCWRSTRPIRSSPPPSPARSTSGSASPSRGAD